jgi:hypothetical protein
MLSAHVRRTSAAVVPNSPERLSQVLHVLLEPWVFHPIRVGEMLKVVNRELLGAQVAVHRVTVIVKYSSAGG